MPIERFPIDSRRAARIKRLQTLQHVFAALTLALTARQHLQHARGLLLPSLELGAAALLVVAAVRERLRHARGRGHDAVGWVEIAGGVMALVEAVVKTREPHHLSFLILGFVQPLILFLFGIFDMRINTLRYLEASDARLLVRQRLIWRRAIRWSDARAFQFRGTALEVETEGGGTRTFSMRDLLNFEPAKAWTIEQFRRRGIRELPAEELPGGEE